MGKGLRRSILRGQDTMNMVHTRRISFANLELIANAPGAAAAQGNVLLGSLPPSDNEYLVLSSRASFSVDITASSSLTTPFGARWNIGSTARVDNSETNTGHFNVCRSEVISDTPPYNANLFVSNFALLFEQGRDLYLNVLIDDADIGTNGSVTFSLTGALRVSYVELDFE